jgi:hypothetical protein
MAHVAYTKGFSAYPSGETLDRQRLIDDAQAEAALTQALANVVIDDAAETVTYYYAAALDQTQQDALDAVVAAYQFETLAGVKARLVQSCIDWRDYKMNVPQDPVNGILIEYPASSGKKWSIKAGDVVLWSALATVKDNGIWPMRRRTWDEGDSYEFVNATDFEAFYALIRDAVLNESDACDAALDNVIEANDKANAESAAAVYLGA